MKKVLIALMILGAISAQNQVFAQKKSDLTLENYDKSKMPKYIVLVAEKGGFIFGSDVEVEKRRSKSKDELKWLESYLDEHKASRNLTDLLNTMDELSFEFIDFVESSNSGGGIGDDFELTSEKNRILFVFKRKDD